MYDLYSRERIDTKADVWVGAHSSCCFDFAQPIANARHICTMVACGHACLLLSLAHHRLRLLYKSLSRLV